MFCMGMLYTTYSLIKQKFIVFVKGLIIMINNLQNERNQQMKVKAQKLNDLTAEMNLWTILKTCNLDKVNQNEIRNYLSEKYYGLVNKIAKEMHTKCSSTVSYEELLSDAFMGLINAIESYDFTKNVPFVYYAYKRIKGYVIDNLGQRYIPSKRIRNNISKIKKAKKELREKLQRDPTNSEIMSEINMSKNVFNRAMRAYSITNSTSIYEPNERNDEEHTRKEEHVNSALNVASDSDPEKIAIKKELMRELRKAIESLTDRQKEIIDKYYFKNLNSKKIAKGMGISEQRVRQILGDARKALAKKLDFMKDCINIL